jgi:hypothetical protein
MYLPLPVDRFDSVEQSNLEDDVSGVEKSSTDKE